MSGNRGNCSKLLVMSLSEALALAACGILLGFPIGVYISLRLSAIVESQLQNASKCYTIRAHPARPRQYTSGTRIADSRL